VPVAILTIELAAIRPPLARRSDRVLAGEALPRSHAHVYYVVFESLRVLLPLGVATVVL